MCVCDVIAKKCRVFGRAGGREGVRTGGRSVEELRISVVRETLSGKKRVCLSIAICNFVEVRGRQKRAARSRVVVVCYHRVVDQTSDLFQTLY